MTRATSEPVWTILKLLKWSTRYFSTRKIDNPRMTAEILLAFVLNIKRIDLYVQFDRPMEKWELDTYKGVIKRRIDHEPVAYITGEKGFWSLELKVSPAVLIPRPDTESLVEAAFEFIPKNRAMRILELGTGSGAISLALASERPQSSFLASDISIDAIKVASENAQRCGLKNRIGFFCGNWFDALKPPPRRFDMILSNPPYIRQKSIPQLQPEIYTYEPIIALDGGLDGLDKIRHIIGRSVDFLEENGVLLLEIGHDQAEDILAYIGEMPYFDRIEVRRDYAGKDRVLVVHKKKEETVA